MLKGLIGRKIGMTQIFDESGRAIPVTLLEAGPCFVSQVKDAESDGYSAVQLAFGEVKPKRLSKAELGHLKTNNLPPVRVLREFRTKKLEDINPGDELKASVFATGEYVDVIGTSKGKGFQGTVKRWNFSRGPMTHGCRNQRKPGSIGQCAYPARVRKGLHMYGHMGDARVTVKNLKLVRVDAEQNLMLVKGAVPGGKNGLVQVRMA